jgi:hypothetical protein
MSHDIYFCLRKNGCYGHFYKNIINLKMIADKDERIYLVSVRKSRREVNDCYYGWVDYLDKQLYHISLTKGMLSYAFPQGYKKMEMIGKGQMVYLVLTEIMSFKNISKCPKTIDDLPKFILDGDYNE